MDNYKLIGRAGEGAHGYVFKAVDLRSSKLVAVKKIAVNPDMPIPKNTMREMCALRVLQCKHIVHLQEVTSMGSNVVLVMEFLPCSLTQILKCTELSLSQVKGYALMLFQGIDYMHSLSIMHRDLKPSNLLINNEGQLKIADFGLARIFKQNNNRTYSHQVATRWYRAPELLYGSKTYNQSVDIWAAGCILAEMINKKPLFQGENDIKQLALVLSMLGTPTKESWPDLETLPDYNKISFKSSRGKRWRKLIPKGDHSTLKLISKILIYDHAKRLSASEILEHEFFVAPPTPASLPEMPKPVEVVDKEIEGFNFDEFDELLDEL